MKHLKIALITALLVSCATTAFAQNGFDPEYVIVTNERSQKIVDEMGIADDAKALLVRDLIANQYRWLSSIQDRRDAKIAEIEDSKMEEGKKEEKIEGIKEKAASDVADLHEAYLTKLSVVLNEEQIVQVKDGMTYGVVPLTYNGYLEMLPDLTQEEKDTIREYLIEAREYAMDAGSSDKKHWWFGQYKGKINNYLSAQGYDLNKASKEWQQRIKAEKENG